MVNFKAGRRCEKVDCDLGRWAAISGRPSIVVWHWSWRTNDISAGSNQNPAPPTGSWPGDDVRRSRAVSALAGRSQPSSARAARAFKCLVECAHARPANSPPARLYLTTTRAHKGHTRTRRALRAHTQRARRTRSMKFDRTERTAKVAKRRTVASELAVPTTTTK